jgi:diguanylate cyclase (GGDEF)-like protein
MLMLHKIAHMAHDMLHLLLSNTQEVCVGDPASKTSRILFIEENGSTLKSILTLSNFTVCQLKASDNVFDIAEKFCPDLILSSFEQVESSDIIERLREHHALCHTPVIIIANKYNIKKAIKTLNGNVDDYIVKPFQAEELTARIGRIIHRHERAINSNPLTKLPGNVSIKHEIEKRLEKKSGFCVCYADLDNFKAFNDYYGYEKGDQALQLTGAIMRESLKRHDRDGSTTFLGHIGGDDFIFLTDVESAKRICEDIINGFDQKILALYSDKDLKNGCIISTDRNGNKSVFPVMSISISVVVNKQGEKKHMGEISKIGAELKKYIKGFPGSNFIIDRRSVRKDKQVKTADSVEILKERLEAKHFDKRF